MKNRLFFVSFIFVFIIIFLSFQTGCDIIDEYRYKFIIKGNISNLDDLKNFKDCYLQLCKVSDDGNVSGNVSFEKGTIYDSILSKLEIKSDGFFKFRERTLEPGNYMVCIQGIKSDTKLNGWLQVKETGNLNKFSIPKDKDKNITIDLGILIIPNSR